ncbi:DUF6551 family protein [Dongia deserti]|uniref:DUF6551 family protein n=1 Tax=Dongia deserti TaxID=2268030 RepID=UPI000E658631|nr:DUF6551 family protein [Dongia deserti]
MGKLTASQVRFCCNRLGLPAADIRRLFEAVENDVGRGGKDQLGVPPVQGWVPTSLLFVDPTYQRPITREGWKRIRKIAAEWDWRKYQPVTITGREPGKARLAVIDGQHRWEAAKIREIPRLPFYGISPGDVGLEANAFVTLNRDRVAVSNVNIFWAELAAHAPEAVTIKRICDQAGVAISPVAIGRLPARTVSAVTVLRQILRQSGEDVLARTLHALAEAKPTEADTFGSWALRGVAELVATHGKTIKHDDLVRTLQRIDSTRLVAEMTIAARDWELTRPAAMARLLRDLYERTSSVALPAPAAEKAFHRKQAGGEPRAKVGSTPTKSVVHHRTPGVRRLDSSGGPSAAELQRQREQQRAAEQRMIDDAVKAGRVTRCPTAAVAPTEGAAIGATDQRKLRTYRKQREAAIGIEGWRGPKAQQEARLKAIKQKAEGKS